MEAKGGVLGAGQFQFGAGVAVASLVLAVHAPCEVGRLVPSAAVDADTAFLPSPADIATAVAGVGKIGPGSIVVADWDTEE